MPPSLVPYSLAAPGFQLRSLAALAARAALGGPRELLLAAMQAARMIEGAAGLHPLPESLRRSRANAARTWLAALALPAAPRATVSRAIDASAGNDRDALSQAWDGVVALVTPAADQATRAELKRVTQLVTPGA